MINKDRIYTISTKNLEISIEKPDNVWIVNITLTKTKQSPEPNFQDILKNISQSNISEKFKKLFLEIIKAQYSLVKINKTKMLKMSENDLWRFFGITEEDDVFIGSDDFEGFLYV